MKTRKAKISVQELARQVGVPAATVSRVLNERAVVSEVIRARMIETAAALGVQRRLERQVHDS